MILILSTEYDYPTELVQNELLMKGVPYVIKQKNWRKYF